VAKVITVGKKRAWNPCSKKCKRGPNSTGRKLKPLTTQDQGKGGRPCQNRPGADRGTVSQPSSKKPRSKKTTRPKARQAKKTPQSTRKSDPGPGDGGGKEKRKDKGQEVTSHLGGVKKNGRGGTKKKKADLSMYKGHQKT